ncbi:MAG: ROK family protein [Calditrichaeota bacterium]|nr:MAG: ROK family protein [Calditrichota bacterium]MBL1205107.1 ROK family protein [Calditrichota bacterium]NOG44937.1 ROK family protein [Calditrichota bacterium]
MQILGVDIGGSGIKGAIVDTKSGQLLAERHRIPTPKPATPEAVSKTLKKLVKHFDWKGKIGCGFPAVIRDDIVRTASNIDKKWIGTNAAKLFRQTTGCKVTVLNDADAAGLAEKTFGAGKNCKGVVLIITVGTGLGSALFINGKLVPNTEFGHVYLKGKIAEHYTSDAVRKKEDLSWNEWAKRFNIYLKHMEGLVWPDRIIIGGGASKKRHKFFDELNVNAEVVEATLLNNAGIIGAALAAKSLR